MKFDLTTRIESTEFLSGFTEPAKLMILNDSFDQCNGETQQKFLSGIDETYLISALLKKGYIMQKYNPQ